MAKYTVEDKLQAVERYLNGNESANKIAKSLGVEKRQFLNGLSNMNTMVLKLLFSHIQITH